MRATTYVWGLGALAALAAGCGTTGIEPGTPDGGVATVAFKPRPFAGADVTPTVLELALAHVQILGDAPPPPPPDMPPPRDDMGGPPPGGVRLDLLSTDGGALSFDDLQQGVYSRVQFGIEELRAKGTASGVPFEVHLDFMFMPHGGGVNLRAGDGQDLGPGMDVKFTVDVDANGWFAGGVVERCPMENGAYVVDRAHCPMACDVIAMRIAPSFSLE